MNGLVMNPGLLLPPLLAGLLVLSTHVLLGQQVLKRGIIFIDLAVAQLAGLGVILIHLLQPEPGLLLIQLSAFGAALAGAGLMLLAERRLADRLEAVIGVIFVLATSSALLLLAGDPHGGDRLRELLSGQLLWVGYGDLWLPALLSAAVLLLWRIPACRHRPLGFYLLFAIAITSSVQLVGVYLVFASLIIPALAQPNPHRWLAGYLVGSSAYALGLYGSLITDLPTGPLVVWCLALTAIAYRTMCQTLARRA